MSLLLSCFSYGLKAGRVGGQGCTGTPEAPYARKLHNCILVGQRSTNQRAATKLGFQLATEGRKCNYTH